MLTRPRVFHPLSLRAFSASRLQVRCVSSTGNQRDGDASLVTGGAAKTTSYYPPVELPVQRQQGTVPPPLSLLPLSSVVRSLLLLTASSTPIFLKPSIAALQVLANPKLPLFDVAKNPVLNWLVKRTLYAQFNAGENRAEVQRSIKQIKDLGCKGVILGYAREMLASEGQVSETEEHAAITGKLDIETWKKGTLDTVEMATEGDFVALKVTGIGRQAVELLKQNKEPSEDIANAIKEVCDAAIARNVRLLVDAEEQAVQPGIESWTLKYQKYCNKHTPNRAIMYGTYQAYLRSAPATISRHLAIAREEGYTLGVKMVRGAYMKTEPRHVIWATKEDTDACYDGIVADLLTQKYGSTLRPTASEVSQPFPSVNLIIATHSQDSVRKAHAIRRQQAENGQPRIELSYAQLQGMADEVSCELAQYRHGGIDGPAAAAPLETPLAYKLLTWGTTKECMGFLMRRAMENTEAMTRTRHSKEAMAEELRRRFRSFIQGSP
ncbi:hypothetical protein FQN54_002918 [Arachnomyces sp. PD_36]|nr:hypothetical protein FQN54_002918 [Arachnomyces sp. PD_36]